MTMASTGGGDTGGGGSSTCQQAAPAPSSHATPLTPAAGTTAAAAPTTSANVAAVAELPMADDNYDELSIIGNGAYGTVYRGRDRNNKERYVALKKIKITLEDYGVPVNAVREIALLKQLEKFEHPNIVRLLDICHGRLEQVNRLNLILVFEYVEQDLDKYLQRCPSPGLEPERIRMLMHQILCGVDFLHSNRIIHRDLKPQNLLVAKNSQVKIADFGLARIYDFNMRLTTRVVTLYYRAPEVLLSNSYATPVDIWSCGCIFAELFRRQPLFKGTNEGDQLQRIFDVIGRPRENEWPRDVSISLTNFRDHVGRSFADIVPEISADASDVLKRLLRFVPSKRYSARDALSHPYFRGLHQPRVTASSNRSTPTQQILSPSRYNASSPTTMHQHFTSTTSSSVVTMTSTDTMTSPDMMSTQVPPNDENNPNAGNSANTTTSSFTSIQEPKLTDRGTSTSPIETSETATSTCTSRPLSSSSSANTNL